MDQEGTAKPFSVWQLFSFASSSFHHSMNSTFLIQLKLPVPYLSFHVLITGTNVMEVKAGHQCAINSSLQAWRFRVFTFNIRCD